MDGRQEKIEIPQIVYEGDDKKMKERITKFKTGTLRIVVFTIVGLIMGAYSHRYVTDDFILTKVITAIPYKISETIYVFLLGTDAAELFYGGRMFGWMTEFFPHSMLATWIAETVTTALIGAAIYGSLAYFTGDKRVFTLQRFLKFAGCWCVVIVAVIGTVYGVNAKAKADNEAFRGDARFYLYTESGGGSSMGDGEVNEMLKSYFFRDLEPMEVTRDRESEVALGIYYNDLRFGLYWANYNENYVVTEQGATYHISEEFSKVAGEFAENKVMPTIPGAQGDMEMSTTTEAEKGE